LSALQSKDILSWCNAGKKTLTEIRMILGSVGLKLADDRFPLAVAQKRFVPDPANSSVLEDQLLNILMSVDIERNAQILIKLWGWNGDSPRTLESVGREFGLTRERVRQIEKRALGRLSRHSIAAPLVQTAITSLRSATPNAVVALGLKLREEGIARGKFSPAGLHIAAIHLRIQWPFEFISLGNKQILTLSGECETYRNAISIVRKKTSDRGCTSVLSLASELGLDEDGIPSLRQVLDAVGKTEWLDESREWLYSAESPRNRLFNICSKILGVAPRIHLSELRRAASKSRRLAMCPPQHILGAFIERFDLGRVENSVVEANPRNVTRPTEDSAEGIMLRVLELYGPVMDGEDFAEKCISEGVNATTFYIYRVISPVIGALGKNVYCKVGTDVAPGIVEDIVKRRRTVPRYSDHGWTNTGRLWCGLELTRQVITSGGIRLPTFVADLVQGEWRVKLPDGTVLGAVTCRDLFIWSFRKAFSVLGAEPADLTTFEFDLKSREVLVKVGGPGLFEAIEEPDSGFQEDGLEEV
jgi:hypothetical protein